MIIEAYINIVMPVLTAINKKGDRRSLPNYYGNI